ncbi:MAG: hypothetical protein QOG59_2126 [Solirubrobacteraceae bacterium]|nr:hypothetical protein [Solirubrobacteraceae bacterium]
MRGVATWGLGALVALLLVVSAASAKSTQVVCPLAPGSPSGGDVQWAFSDSGRPAGNAVKSSYVHGRGSWTSGRATGTACTTDSPTKGGGVRDLVLAVSGRSKLTGRVTQGGLLGVRLVLGVKVRASDAKHCAKGATGTITLFASYYSVHRDTMQIHFSSRCTGHNLSYRGSSLHVYIARHGAQVNTP